MDALNASSKPEMANMSCGYSASMYLGVGDTKHVVHETDSIGIHMDVSTLCRDVLSIEMDVLLPANTPANIRIP